MAQKVVFKRGNLVGGDHPFPVVAEAVLSLACSFPSSIVLLADKPGMIYLFVQLELRKFCLFYS